MRKLIDSLRSTRAGTNLLAALAALALAAEAWVVDFSDAHWMIGTIAASVFAWVNARVGITEDSGSK